MNLSTCTQYSTRDSATGALRKIGVTKSDYDDFIARRDGKFYTDIDGAKKFVAKTSAPVVDHAASNSRIEKLLKSDAKTKVGAKADKAQTKKDIAAAASKEGGQRTGVSAIVRALILEGKSNQEVWDELSSGDEPVLNANQKSYPSWYRCELRRKGHTV
jgi:hypothetical protein